ncbi:Glycoside-Pentoside-Hexuronide family transporter [Phytophthora megakarya]|uniref:Glycoside-Pentoside-Hexuronide family transporter n=1 Tax=Phytophthora megakarya TaxID=4795 RepID=A0A225VLN4_9STRA|nr:Glycoside-Pentoside-Hexuronide family transporter [Phytophthora megakarya]
MRTADYVHPFVIPADLTRPMGAAITTTRNSANPISLSATYRSKELPLIPVGTIDPKLRKFCSRYVNTTTAFYRVKAKAK